MTESTGNMTGNDSLVYQRSSCGKLDAINTFATGILSFPVMFHVDSVISRHVPRGFCHLSWSLWILSFLVMFPVDSVISRHVPRVFYHFRHVKMFILGH